jgi:hypothetical protein
VNRLYSYIVKNDNGSAPNPFWGVCTLTICKPKIRRTAIIGDWVIGTGSKNSELKDGRYDLSGSLVYAMKVSDKKTIREYDQYCKTDLPDKLPKWFNKDWRKKLGDCMYDYSKGEAEPRIRMAVHKERNRIKDLSGLNALLSNHFYYFGEEPRPIPPTLKQIVIKGQGHLVLDDQKLIAAFEKWIGKFRKNKIYANPQGKFKFEVSQSNDCIENC